MPHAVRSWPVPAVNLHAQTVHPLNALRQTALAGYRKLESAFDTLFGAPINPWRHLGALGFFFFWLLALSGIYLYAVLDTSAEGAYRSIDRLSREQWYLGGVLRSLHRYSADAFVVVTLAHLVREWLFGRYHGFRRFSWLTGVPLLMFAFVCGVGGFWLNWDQLGQFSAMATAEWLDWLPVFASPMTRNFLTAGAVGDRLFSLFVFIHLGVPLLLLFGLWFHIQRLSRAAVFPPRALALGTGAALLALALVAPVMSQAAADVAVVPGALALDWFLLFIHPLTDATSSGVVWALLAATLLLLLGLPFLPRPVVAPVAQVDPANCNGCRRCFDDCPYAAITMVPHASGRRGRQMAQVNDDLCASCGICVGSCPSSTPFRSAGELVTGIDMPGSPIGVLRRCMEQALAALPGKHKIVAVGCDHGACIDTLAAPDVAPFSLICTGMLPPSFVEYALHCGAAGVLVSGCCEGGCEFRLGQQWTLARLQGTREPHLRAAAQHQLAVAWVNPGDEAALRAALNELRRRIDTTAGYQHG
jgi:quinol-cytochrome oxidoreductase complex cytochrome b subunit/coenzyme F420-reducing hydrogenase delta subunit/Fe-S-cluster-containing hydrogenase component 2